METTLMMLTTILVALITAVFGPIAVEWAKTYFGKKKDLKTPVREALEVSTLIEDQLDAIIEEIKCDRVWIAQFHNGGHFYPTGKSIQKFSLFHEKTSPNIPTIQHTFQNIPVSLFPRVLSRIYQNSELAIDDVSKTEDTYGLEHLTVQFNTKSICMLGLYSLDNHLIGVLGISFKDPHHLVRDEWSFIRQKTGVIGTLLSEYLYPNNKK